MNAPHPSLLHYPFEAPPAPGVAIDVAPNVRWLRMPLPFALDHINLWIIADGHDRVVIDCGFGDAATRALWATHFTTTLDSRPLTRIIATHYHPDHLGNAQWLAGRFGVGVAMTLGEFLTAHAFFAASEDGWGANMVNLLVAHGMAPEHRIALLARGNGYRRGVPEIPQRFERLVHGDRVKAAGMTFEVIAGHGHSPEHAALYDAGHSLLISGDMLLPRISTNVSIAATDPDGDPLSRFLDSLARFETLPPDTLVLPSHGLPFRGAALRVAQLRAHHAARLSELEEFVRSAPAPVAAADVLQLLFRRELDLQQRFFAMGEAIAHLNYLWRRGDLARTVASDGRIHFHTSA
jgi:glyoxylase-like metal-dependent hydrolase (beta-lactamase superfamily II)